MMKNVFTPAEILLPANQNFRDWAVIACDQFSSEREYWDRVSETVGDKNSTLHMIVPEAYLEGISMEEASLARNETMNAYLSGGVFSELKNAFVYVEREITGGLIRRGIVGKLDLEAYDYLPNTSPCARASERTVVDRLPPRIRVRRGASLEMPHVLVLIDDEKREIVEGLTAKRDRLTPVYDFDLMEGGGHIRGYAVEGKDAEEVVSRIDALGAREVQLVIGDGNHSLAAAKDTWREIKKTLSEEEILSHPARFALVEVCNVYDEGIVFEPIHRIVFDCDPARVLEALEREAGDPAGRPLTYLAEGKSGTVTIRNESLGALIGAVQGVLDRFEAEGCIVDYIHDDASLRKLSEKEGSFALFLPKMEKADLFCTVEKSGVFPKKSFSIGHARDKRYYLECRKIVK
ncbi:MAG: DUF1015 domain-containing protein [Clostridia bacterium]|nr:DUF1015 domain-containing protein [Clostridia bacterium]